MKDSHGLRSNLFYQYGNIIRSPADPLYTVFTAPVVFKDNPIDNKERNI